MKKFMNLLHVGVFLNQEKVKFSEFLKISNKNFTFHRSIWPITHLENVDFKNFQFWIGLLVGEFSKISKKSTTLTKFILMDFR